MIRVLGVLCGAAIATALLTWLVGVPQFTSERESVSEPLAVVSLRDGAMAAMDTPELPEAAAVVATEPEPAPPDETASAPNDEPEEDVVATTAVAVEPEPLPAVEALPDPQWFAFWTPFRSEIAANGFVGRLQSVTGLDYRVVKVKAGVYEVAFAYTEDAEIDSNLSTISAATGLDLPGTR